MRALLAPHCRYDAPDGPIVGADAIVDSYRRAGKLAASVFDFVGFESGLISVRGDRAEICFTDRLTKDGKEYVYRCRQRLHFTPGGLVSRIVHEELPGERQSVLEFCAEHGIKLDKANPAQDAEAG